MKDSQLSPVFAELTRKYIKVNNERFSTLVVAATVEE